MENNLKHLAIILDGNRRFAKRLMLEPWKGHEYGAEKVEKTIDWCTEFGIKELTLYALSIENLNSRPRSELAYLFKVFRNSLRNLSRKKIQQNKIRFKFIGDTSLLPEDLAGQCKKLENETLNNSDFKVNIALAYGCRQEIIEAVRKIVSNKLKKEEITGEVIEKNLYTKDEPDLIIRTGGEKRTSNFLTWQSAYSEWLFLD